METMSQYANLTVLRELSLQTLSATLTINVASLFMATLGMVSTTFTIVTFFRNKSKFNSNHYYLQKTLAVTNLLDVVTIALDFLRRLAEYGAQQPLVMSKVICSVINLRCFAHATMSLQLFCACDRMAAILWPLQYQKWSKVYVRLLFALACGIAVTEQIAFTVTAYFDDKLIPICMIYLARPDALLRIVAVWDNVFAIATLCAYAALGLTYFAKWRSLTSPSLLTNNNNDMRLSVVRACIADGIVYLASLALASVIRQFIAGNSRLNLANMNVAPLISLTQAMNSCFMLFIYCAVNKRFRHAFYETVLQKKLTVEPWPIPQLITV